MDREKTNKGTSEINDVPGGVKNYGMPIWGARELTEEYLEARQRKRRGVDVPFLVLTLIILLIGVIMVLSASFARSYYLSGEPMRFFMRQLIFAVSGVCLMIVVSYVKVSTMSRWSLYGLLGAIGLLILVLFIGVKLNGARRWIGVGELTFQPSEIAKIAVILSFAQMTCKFGKSRMRTLKYGVLPFGAIAIIIVILLEREPHLSAAIIITALSGIMMFAGGTRLRWFLLIGLLGAAAVSILI